MMMSVAAVTLIIIINASPFSSFVRASYEHPLVLGRSSAVLVPRRAFDACSSHLMWVACAVSAFPSRAANAIRRGAPPLPT